MAFGERDLARTPRPQVIAAALAASLLLILCTFCQTLGFDFVKWDDPLHLTENELVTHPDSVPPWDHFQTPKMGYPMPVTVLSYRLENAVFGMGSPIPYHATNLLLHLCACLLVFFLGRRLGLNPSGAICAMLVFGLHPAVAEPVSWITGRKDLLAAVFSLWAALEALRHPFQPRHIRSWVSPVLFLAASLSKPVALFLVLLIPAWRLLAGDGWRRALIAAAPLVIIALAVFPLAFIGQQATGSIQELDGLSVLRQAWFALGFNFRLLFMIETPSAVYLPQPWPPPFAPGIDLMPLGGVALALLATRLRTGSGRRVGAAAVAWAALAYLPSSNLIQLTRYLADVYLYLSIAGVGWIMGALIDRWADKIPAHRRWWVRVALPITFAVVLAPRTHSASSKWENSVTLWNNAYLLYPHDMRLCRNTGNGYNEMGEPRLALNWYLQCKERFRSDFFDQNIAVTLYALGHREEARALFLALAEKQPNNQVVRKYLTLLKSE
ncbi:MAG: hypothetical protein GY762_17760 [Proteobacteria bacterium]|nr:hypothetical protein [Pseudomonadota bacterium]